MADDSRTAALAARAAALQWTEAPADVRSCIRRALLDALACAVGGAVTDISVLHRRVLAPGVEGEATVLASGGRAGAPAAAFLNATAINAMDWDDTAPVSGHPGSAIIAAALAAAERVAAAGPDLLAGLLAGYETAMRVASACRPSADQYDLVHGSQTFLPFGAAAAAGRVLRLSPEAMARALGIAGANAPVPAAGKFGFDEPQLSWIKDNVNMPAEQGVRAALLAAAGMPASHTILDGPKGFWRMAASDCFDEAALGDGGRWLTRALAFKPYPCCRWLHGALDAATLARSQRPKAAVSDIASVRLAGTRAVARAFGNRRPATMIDAEYSAPHALAAHLSGLPRIGWWRAASRTDPIVVRLMDAVELTEDPALTEAFLAGGRNINRIPARVEIRWRDGTASEGFTDFPLGTPDRPPGTNGLDEAAEFRAKYAALLGLAGLAEARVREGISRLEAGAGVDTLTALFAGGGHGTATGRGNQEQS